MTDTSAIAALGDVPQPPNPLDIATKIQHIRSAQTLQQLQEQEMTVSRAKLASHLQGALGGWTYAWGNDPDMSYQKAQDQFNLVRTQNPQLSPLVDALSSRLRPDMSPDQIRQAFRNYGFASEAPNVQQKMNDPTTHFVTINGVTFPFSIPRAGNQYGQAPVPVQSGQPLVGPVTVEGTTDEQGRPVPTLATPSWGGQSGGGNAAPGVNSNDGSRPNPANPPRLNAKPNPGGGGGGSNNGPPPPQVDPNAPPVSAGAAIAGTGSGNLPVPPVPPAQPPAPAAAPAVAATPPPAAPPASAAPAAPPPAAAPSKTRLGPLALDNPLFRNVTAEAQAQPGILGQIWNQLNPIGTARADGVGPIRAVPNTTPPAGAGGAPPSRGGGYGQSADTKAGIIASAERLKADDEASGSYLQQRLPFEESLRLYDGGQVTTGPLSSWLNSVEGAIRTGAKNLGLPVDTSFNANEKYDGIRKWETQIAATTGFAGKSVAHLDAMLEGNASANINDQAAVKMLKTGVVMRNAGYAINQQWHAMTPQQQWDASPQHTYLGYLQQAQRNTDLRAFALPYLSAAEQKTLIANVNKMSPEEQASFRKSMALSDQFTPSGDMTKPLPGGQ